MTPEQEQQVKAVMEVLKREIKVWNDWKVMALAMEIVDAVNNKRSPK